MSAPASATTAHASPIGTHHTERDIKDLERKATIEEKKDEKTLAKAQKDLKYAEKDAVKSGKNVDKALHTKDKAEHYEHKTLRKMHDAVVAHDKAQNNVKVAEKNIAVRENEKGKAAQAVVERKSTLQQVEERVAINQEHRDARFHALHETMHPPVGAN